MCSFYRGIIESILTSCIIVWFGSCTAFNRRILQRRVSVAGKIIGASLPSLLDIYNTHLACKATPPIPHTASSVSCNLGEDTGASKPAPPDWVTALSIRLTGC